MGGVRNRVCLICPFTRHIESAPTDNRETQVVALLPLL